MLYRTGDVLRSPVFQIQLIIGTIINFGVNFGFEWATLSDYGQKSSLYDMKYWTQNGAKASIVSDVLITSFLLGYLSIVLATWGIKDEVRKKFNIKPIHKSVLEAPEWRYFWPVRVQGVCKRGFCFGFFFMVCFGLPYLAILGAALDWDTAVVSGKNYCVIKSCYCGVMTLFIFPGMFFSAISSDKFERPEYAYLLEEGDTGSSKQVPLQSV